ncbi:MAG: hypothetical protein IJQ15_11410 [Synergistaceae bacterium]|nr:hypothetical protein [Synergistaceae bacterium]
MNALNLNEDDMQSLKTSLLGFVRRVAFQGAEQQGEATAFFLVVNLLLGDSLALDFDSELESEKSQESENSGYALMPEP